MSKKKIKPLSERERVFVEEYLVSLKPEAAARKAGYAESTCKTKAFGWVSESKCPKNKRHMLEAINEAKRKRSEKSGIDAAWVLKRAALIADFNIHKFMSVSSYGLPYYDFSEATEDDWYCISEVTVDQIWKGNGDDRYEVERIKLKPEAKLQALKLVGDHVDVQAFRENLQVDVTDKRDALRAARERAVGRTRS